MPTAELVTDYDVPICPFCKYPSDKGQEIDSRWETIYCKKCGRNFYARKIKVYETKAIKISGG